MRSSAIDDTDPPHRLMRLRGPRSLWLTSLLLVSVVSVTPAAWAASSLNYQLVADGIVAGGEQATAPTTRLYRACLGEVIANDVASTTMKLSEGVFVIQNHLNLLLPHKAPTFNALTTPTAIASQTLSGTKAADTSLWLNGTQILPLNADTTWSYTYSLIEGTNVLNLLTKDLNGNASATITTSILLDTTPPTTPVVTDDGAFTSTFTQLHATWTSSDPGSGLAAFEYRIGTTSTGSEVVAATSAGLATTLTRTGLTLVQGQLYYIAIRAKNGAGTWSDWGVSDGIYANASAPILSTFSPADGQKFTHGTTVTLSATATDADGDALAYQFSVNGTIKQSWSLLNTYSWLTTVSDIGLTTLLVEVRDGHGGSVTKQQEVYILRRPVSPP